MVEEEKREEAENTRQHLENKILESFDKSMQPDFQETPDDTNVGNDHGSM